MYTDFRGRALKIQECWVKTGLTVILCVLFVRLLEFYKAWQMQEEGSFLHTNFAVFCINPTGHKSHTDKVDTSNHL